MSRRVAIWSAAALSLIFALVLSAALFQPAFGSGGDDNSDGAITVDSTSQPAGDDGVWYGDDDDGHEHEGQGAEERENDDDD